MYKAGKWVLGVVGGVFLSLATATFAGMMGQGGDGKTASVKRTDGRASSAIWAKATKGTRAKSVADGLSLAGTFTYSFVSGNATVTVEQVNNDSSAPTGTLRLSVWAVPERPARGQGFSGYRLVTFPDLQPLAEHSNYSNIVRSDSFNRPPDGVYWIVLELSEYNPTACPDDGYCLEDTFVSFEQVAWGSNPPTYNYSDLWWNPNESGWGVSIVHHSDNMVFAAWYTYDESGRSKWYVAPSCQMNGDYCSGTLYETMGPPFGQSFSSASVVATPVGDVEFAFTSQGSAIMTYNVRGFVGTENIQRQPF